MGIKKFMCWNTNHKPNTDFLNKRIGYINTNEIGMIRAKQQQKDEYNNLRYRDGFGLSEYK